MCRGYFACRIHKEKVSSVLQGIEPVMFSFILPFNNMQTPKFKIQFNNEMHFMLPSIVIRVTANETFKTRDKFTKLIEIYQSQLRGIVH